MDLSLGRSSLDRPIPFRLLLKFAYRLKVFQNASDTKASFDLWFGNLLMFTPQLVGVLP